ncbi:MAG: ABC transporter permease [Bacteroidetes bacterium]|nr:MAG: ABC transporter permease [Bacteroidota bacterium]
MLLFRLIRESYLFAIYSLLANRLQTVLSLLGITIGIFMVIFVFTITDSFESSVRSSVSELGSNVLYIQKRPWIFDQNTPWWKFSQRPNPSMKDAKALRQRCTKARSVGFIVSGRKNIQYKGKDARNTTYVGGSQEYEDVFSFEISEGRYFTPLESASGVPVGIVGSEVADKLFGSEVSLGKQLKIMGRRVKIIGVFLKEGTSMMGQSHDNQILLPINFVRKVVNVNSGYGNPTVIVRAKEDVEGLALKEEVRMILRSVHRLKPAADDDFALNEISTLNNVFDDFFSVLGKAGWFIGGLALLVGGFGIANIMFVSVHERTVQIGIQKALGAKNYFILFQFLFESIFLSLFGGLFGLLFVFLSVLGIRYGFDFDASLNISNIIMAVSVSLIIGLFAGLIPAYMASRLNPVEAIRAA